MESFGHEGQWGAEEEENLEGGAKGSPRPWTHPSALPVRRRRRAEDLEQRHAKHCDKRDDEP